GLTAATLIGLSLVVHGFEAWQHWWAVVPELQWRIISAEEFDERRKLTHLMMPGVMPGLRILGAPEMVAQGLQWLVSIGVLAGVALALRRPRRFEQTVLLLAAGGLLVTPYGFNYDMTFFCAGIVLWWAARPRLTLYETALSGMAYLLPLLVYVFNVTDAPVAPIILALVFCMILRDIMRPPLREASASGVTER
ncbi:MAG: hypothetical protein K2X09_02820, partial [Rickettsiales bacterium]|nr:hypothetical protein [Rickettsiales bacterium]